MPRNGRQSHELPGCLHPSKRGLMRRDNLVRCVIHCSAGTSWCFVALCHSGAEWGDVWIWDCLLVLKGIKKKISLLLFNDTFIRIFNNLQKFVIARKKRRRSLCLLLLFLDCIYGFMLLIKIIQHNFFFKHSVNPLPCRGGQLSRSPRQIASSGSAAEALYACPPSLGPPQ